MKSKKHNSPHGGSWKVAYADFVTAMMALFLCLWLTAQDSKIKDAVERAFRNPFSAVNKESTGIIPNQEKDANTTGKTSEQSGKFASSSVAEMEMLRHITEDLAKMLEDVDVEQKPIQMEITPEGLRINVFDRSNKPIFEPDSDVFTPYGSWVFSTLAWEISRYQTFKIELEGHSELSTQAGRENRGLWEISADRANAARRILIQNGVLSDQVCKVAGLADTQPVKGLPLTDAANRRVTVLLKLRSPDQRNEITQVSNASQS